MLSVKQYATASSLTWAASLRALLAAGGVGRLYSSYAATLSRNVPSAALRFAAYESLRGGLSPAAGLGVAAAAAGAGAGALASALTTPMDVMKTRYNAGLSAGPLLPAVRAVVKGEGGGALLAGVKARVGWR